MPKPITHSEITRKRAGDLDLADQLPLHNRLAIVVTAAHPYERPRRLPRIVTTTLGLSRTVSRVAVRFSDGSTADWRATRQVRILAKRHHITDLTGARA